MLHRETVTPSTLGLLRSLQSLSSLKETRLVGGTSLALQKGHRISIDLDFFGYKMEEDWLTVLAQIRKLGCEARIVKQTSNILIIILDGVKVDIVNYPYPWIDEKIEIEGIYLATCREIAAMKLSAITNRGSKKDFIDLYTLLQQYTLSEMLNSYSEKYSDGSEFLAIKSLTYFEDADLEISPKMLSDIICWEEIKKKIITEVKNYSRLK